MTVESFLLVVVIIVLLYLVAQIGKLIDVIVEIRDMNKSAVNETIFEANVIWPDRHRTW